MSKEFIDSQIDMAHDELNNGEYQATVGRLKNLKARIHEPEPSNEVKTFEDEHDKKFKDRLTNIDNDSKDELRKDQEIAEEYYRYALAYLNFFDKLRKEYDIY